MDTSNRGGSSHQIKHHVINNWHDNFTPGNPYTFFFYPSVHLPVKQSILEAIEHLLARYLDMRPLFFTPALPMNDE